MSRSLRAVEPRRGRPALRALAPARAPRPEPITQPVHQLAIWITVTTLLVGFVYAWGMASSGVPREWAAGKKQPGVNFLDDLSARSLEAIARRIEAEKRPGDRVVASIHWGGNWGYGVTQEQRDFAHDLIDRAGVDVVHGHSSHHAKGIEVWHDRLILYGCGDFVNDYEGIGGYEEYRGDLALMYFASLDAADGRLSRLELVPTRTRRMRIERAPEEGRRWLMATLNREGEPLGTRVEGQPTGELLVRWRPPDST